MYVRLAFAVAAHLESEILIVDEVLAVGDAEFQKKCLGKMNDVSKGEGRTVLFVSHNMSAVQSLCKKGILMEYGESSSGNVIIEKVISEYQKSGLYLFSNIWEGEIHSSNGIIKLNKVTLSNNSNIDVYSNDVDLQLEFHYQVVTSKKRKLRILFNLETQDNIVCFSSGIFIDCSKEGFFKAEVIIPKEILNIRTYNITARVDYPAESVYIKHQHFISFEIQILNIHSYGTIVNDEPNGILHLPLKYRIT